jgi:hypothetical protein
MPLVVDQEEWLLALTRIPHPLRQQNGCHLAEILQTGVRIVYHEAEDVRGLQLEIGRQIDGRMRRPRLEEGVQSGQRRRR